MAWVPPDTPGIRKPGFLGPALLETDLTRTPLESGEPLEANSCQTDPDDTVNPESDEQNQEKEGLHEIWAVSQQIPQILGNRDSLASKSREPPAARFLQMTVTFRAKQLIYKHQNSKNLRDRYHNCCLHDRSIYTV